jgi:exopolysaccharide biosynthesis polyprenyl glycosylphosphotransferase
MSRNTATALGPGTVCTGFAVAKIAERIPREHGKPGADAVDGIALEPCAPRSLHRRDAVARSLLVTADVAALTAVIAALFGRFGMNVEVVVAVAGVPPVLFLFKVAGLYDRDELRLIHSTVDEAPVLLQLTGLLALVYAILMPSVRSGGLDGAGMAALWAGSFGALMIARVVARSFSRRLLNVERCLVVGELGRAERIRERLLASGANAVLVGCVAGEDIAGLEAPQIIRSLIHEFDVHRVIFAPASTATEGVLQAIRIAKAVGVRITVLPRILEVVGSTAAFDELEGIAMLGVPRLGLSRSSRGFKRALDLVVSAGALVLLAPVLAVIAVAIRLDSEGPVFFRQVRVGHRGRHFSIVKFRTMVADADERKQELRSLSIAGAGLFKVKNDPRVTRVGSFLRKSSLDELPQLINVLRGDMSLVGPRPLVIDEDAQVRGLDRSRLRLTPGITGPWQVLGTRVPLDEMVQIDYLYIASWSLWLDVRILLRTIRHVLRRANM